VLATTKEPVRIPFETEHVDVTIAVPPVNEQVVSPVENPVPLTDTVAPTSADEGVRVMCGVGVINWKLAVAKSVIVVAVAVIV
jgi:hypothetical protein